MEQLKIQQAARLAGVSPKTLRHYERIGLLSPAGTSPAGYRLYGPDQLRRLQEILLLRELDFPLRDIAALLSVPGQDRIAALRRQKALLEQKRLRLDGVIALVEQLLKGDETMDLQAFHTDALDAAKDQYAQEAKQRWGDTEAYRESQRRQAGYTDAQRAAAQAEQEALLDSFAALASGDSASPQA